MSAMRARILYLFWCFLGAGIGIGILGKQGSPVRDVGLTLVCVALFLLLPTWLVLAVRAKRATRQA